MLTNVVTTSGLTKHYGSIKAVDNLSLEIPARSVFGILGPNGSGKTTTLGMLLNVVNPTSGTFAWFGSSSHSDNRQRIGSILETPAFYPYLSALDNLKIVAEIKAIGFDNIDSVLKTTGLYDRRFSAYRTFSLGMKQRLAIAAALLCDPQVMILDEPTNGLDPKGIAEIRTLIKDIALQDKTIILASHLLDEVQKVCTHFAVLNKGKLIHTGPVFEHRDQQLLEIGAEKPAELLEIIQQFPEPLQATLKDNLVTVTLPAHVRVGNISRFLFEKGIDITHLLLQQKSLETQFLEILNEQA